MQLINVRAKTKITNLTWKWINIQSLYKSKAVFIALKQKQSATLIFNLFILQLEMSLIHKWIQVPRELYAVRNELNTQVNTRCPGNCIRLRLRQNKFDLLWENMVPGSLFLRICYLGVSFKLVHPSTTF